MGIPQDTIRIIWGTGDRAGQYVLNDKEVSAVAAVMLCSCLDRVQVTSFEAHVWINCSVYTRIV